jgi:hypothetical protein
LLSHRKSPKRSIPQGGINKTEGPEFRRKRASATAENTFRNVCQTAVQAARRTGVRFWLSSEEWNKPENREHEHRCGRANRESHEIECLGLILTPIGRFLKPPLDTSTGLFMSSMKIMQKAFLRQRLFFESSVKTMQGTELQSLAKSRRLPVNSLIFSLLFPFGNAMSLFVFDKVNES